MLDEEGNEENWSGMIKMEREGERRKIQQKWKKEGQRERRTGKEKKKEMELRERVGEEGENLGC